MPTTTAPVQQASTARLIEVFDQEITDWYEYGMLSLPRVERINRIARTLGVSVEDRARALGLVA